jgi:hypothetical protein
MIARFTIYDNGHVTTLCARVASGKILNNPGFSYRIGIAMSPLNQYQGL